MQVWLDALCAGRTCLSGHDDSKLGLTQISGNYDLALFSCLLFTNYWGGRTGHIGPGSTAKCRTGSVPIYRTSQMAKGPYQAFTRTERRIVWEGEYPEGQQQSTLSAAQGSCTFKRGMCGR